MEFEQKKKKEVIKKFRGNGVKKLELTAKSIKWYMQNVDDGTQKR